MRLININSDHIGITASSLCMLHCFFTPFIFLSQASISINQELSFLWQSFNYAFLIISLIAIYFSVKNSSRLHTKVLLIVTWFALSILIINEVLEISSIPELYTYAVSSSLCGLHIYNLKFCRCNDDNCCKD